MGLIRGIVDISSSLSKEGFQGARLLRYSLDEAVGQYVLNDFETFELLKFPFLPVLTADTTLICT